MFPPPPAPTFKMLRCVPLSPQEAVMCPPPLTGCYTTLFRLRMMPRVLLQAQAAVQVGIAKKVDQCPQPQPEDVAVMCPRPPPPSVCCDMSSQPSECCCVFASRLRMLKCVLSPAQAAEKAVMVQKVDLRSSSARRR